MRLLVDLVFVIAPSAILAAISLTRSSVLPALLVVAVPILAVPFIVIAPALLRRRASRDRVLLVD